MQKYKRFVIVIVLAIIIAGPIGQFLLLRYTPFFDISLKTCLYDTASWVHNKPKVIIMGSSHALHQIIPDNIVSLNPQYKKGDIVNIGAEAASPFEMMTSYKKNRKKFSNIKIAYFTLEPHMLSEKYYLYNTYEKIFLNYSQWKYFESTEHIANSFFYPAHIFYDALKFDCPGQNKYNGYIPLKHTSFNIFKPGQVPKKIYKPFELFPISVFELNAIKKLKNMVEEDGGKFIFVLTPTYSWYKFYEKEANLYDEKLVGLLNKYVGKSVVIGSFDKNDFSLSYDNFKDDTHLSHSGAIIFTNSLFNNISKHFTLSENIFKHLYTYHFDNKSAKKIIHANDLQWKTEKNTSSKRLKDCIVFNVHHIYKKVKFYAPLSNKFSGKFFILNVKLPSEKISMVSITLYRHSDKKVGYAHYFIRDNLLPNTTRQFLLSPSNISKHSENFLFSDIDAIAIRLYSDKKISDFRIKEITITR